MHAAASRGNLPHHQLIYPPSLRYLPIWTLGALARQHAAIGGDCPACAWTQNRRAARGRTCQLGCCDLDPLC